MTITCLPVFVETNVLEPFDDRIDILFRELELATKWQRPSVLLAVYSSEYVRADADIALENRLHNLGQSAYHIKIKDQAGADVCCQISELANLDSVVFFVEGLGWGTDRDNCITYQTLNNRREFFIENQVRVVFWLTEKEAIDLAHFAPDYWAFRHRVIEFVDSPNPDQISPHVVESAWQWTGELADTTQDLDAKIALRTALLTDLPNGNESTAARANLLLTLGILHWRRGDYERATQFLNTALDLAARLEDDFFEALCFNAIALVKTDLGRNEEAIEAFQNAVRLAPEQISPWNNLGNLYRKLGRHAEALTAFQKAIEQNGADAVGWNGLGDLYLETGRNDEAVYAYLKAIEFSPDYANSWCGLGNSHLQEGRLEDAETAHQKAIEIDRRTVNSWLGLGDIYRRRGDKENASMAYQTALELEPRNAMAWNELGNIYYEACAYDQAMRSYQKSIEFNQGNCPSYGKLASIYIIKGLHADAIPLLLRGLELTNDNNNIASLWKQLGDVYQLMGDYENAKTAYRRADEFNVEATEPVVEISSLTQLPQISQGEALCSPATPTSESDQPEDPSPMKPDSTVPASQPQEPADENKPEKNSTDPDNEFMDWLDGLASVMPIESQAQEEVSVESSKRAAGLGNDSTDSKTEPDFQTDFFNQPILPNENETDYSNEFSTESLSDHFSSYVPFEGETIKLDQLLELEEIQEKEASSLEVEDNPEQEESTSFEEAIPPSNPMDPDETSDTQVSVDEKNAQIWNELGNIYFNTGAYEEASHAFEMAIELDPSYGWSYNNLASVQFQKKNYADAISLYEKGLRLMDDNKDKAVLWNRLGDAYRRLSEQDQAATAYRKAIELDPENVSLLTRARLSLLGNLLS